MNTIIPRASQGAGRHDATEDDAIVYALDTPIPGTDAEVGHRVEIAIYSDRKSVV